ncbi:hypothetical protein V493_02358 [Pseudogymnoascus sp. VKM F-4281 (FW-2241)]|nr:hypothetical protein V493_02358 [Pseudogymnoascus sp. VKM F-4281 (FW-2241)]
MPIRDAIPADYPRMAEVAAAAFMEDDVYGRFMFPHRRQYPDDYISQWERRIKIYATMPEYEHQVAVDELTGSVVAWACWERIGPGAAARENPLSLRIKNLYATVMGRLVSFFWPDRSADPEHIKAFKDAVPYAAHLWSGDREDAWNLDILCTHPDFEGKKHGSSLVKWGISQAEGAGICTSVIAAWEKDPYYERFAFKEAGRADVGPIAGVKGGAVMFRDKQARD